MLYSLTEVNKLTRRTPTRALVIYTIQELRAAARGASDLSWRLIPFIARGLRGTRWRRGVGVVSFEELHVPSGNSRCRYNMLMALCGSCSCVIIQLISRNIVASLPFSANSELIPTAAAVLES